MFFFLTTKTQVSLSSEYQKIFYLLPKFLILTLFSWSIKEVFQFENTVKAHIYCGLTCLTFYMHSHILFQQPNDIIIHLSRCRNQDTDWLRYLPMIKQALGILCSNKIQPKNQMYKTHTKILL